MSRQASNTKAKEQNRNWLKAFVAVTLIAVMGLIYLDAKVRYSLYERQWQLPARVFARPLILTVNYPLKARELETELYFLGYRERARVDRPGDYRRSGNEFWIYRRAHNALDIRVAAQRIHIVFSRTQVTALEVDEVSPNSVGSSNYSALKSVAFEPLEIGSLYPRHREDRELVQLAQTPKLLPEVLMLVEDRNFNEHLGLSPRGIARAMIANYKAGRTVQGGSTITQQLVKNVFLNRDRSVLRKAVEALMSLLVELHFSKGEILESYINEVYLGQEGSRSIHGFALASKHYFSRPLYELSTSQIALLVGMVKGPAYYNPWRHPERAIERRNTVLSLMERESLISAEQSMTLRSSGLGLAKASALEGVYPAYIDLVRRQLRRDYSAESLQTEGLKIYTAFDPLVQRHAEQSLAKVLSDKPESIEGAVVISDVTNGNVVAVVGGRQMRYAGFNRALDAVRPVGSLMKPVIYLAALEQSKTYTLAKTLSDRAVNVAGADGSTWSPRNFDRREHGDVLMHRALSKSYNQAAARLGMELGLREVLAMSKRLGVKRELPAVPSMLLGSGAMSPFEVTGMYQTIAASGVYSPLRTIVNIADSGGKNLARYPLIRKKVVDPRTMHLLHYSLIEVVREGTGKSAYSRLPKNFNVAGKTGTTNDLRDSWFAGYAGDYLAVVWLGRDDNKSAGLTGSSGALKVWTEFINRASRKPVDFSVPAGVVYRWVNQRSGLLSRELCEESRYLPFLQGTAPTQRSACKTTVPSVWKWFKNVF